MEEARLLNLVLSLMDGLAGVCEGVKSVIGKIIAAISEKTDVDGIATAVKSALRSAVEKTVTFVDKLSRLGAINKMKKLGDMISNWVVQVVQTIATKVRGLVAKIVNPIRKKLGFAKDSPVPPAEGRNKKSGKPVRVGADANGEIFIEWNPTIPLSRFLRIISSSEGCNAALDDSDVSAETKTLKQEATRAQNAPIDPNTKRKKYKPSQAAKAAYKSAAERLQEILQAAEDCDLGEASPCDIQGLGIDSSGVTSDAREWKYKSVRVFDERGPKFTETRGQYIDQDVVDYAIARLKKTSGGSAPNTAARAWIQCTVGVKKDDAGHVIGDALGGGGKLLDGNIFPQNFSKNRGVQSSFETNVIKPAVESEQDVCVVIKLIYTNTSEDYPGRPTKVLYHAWIDGKKHEREFDNPFPENAFEPVPPGGRNYCSEQSE